MGIDLMSAKGKPIEPDGYCAQCTTERFGDYEPTPLTQQITRAQSKELLFASVLCAGCGYTFVDDKGRCMSKKCTEQHGDY